jgi:hypothetical protein
MRNVCVFSQKRHPIPAGRAATDYFQRIMKGLDRRSTGYKEELIMKRTRRIVILVILSILAFGLSFSMKGEFCTAQIPAPSSYEESPGPSPSASPSSSSGDGMSVKDLVEAMDKAFPSVVDYSFTGYIRTEKGPIVVDYRCFRPRTVRSEILEGRGKGAVVLYVPDQREDSVKVKSGSFRVWRNIKKLKIDNTPLVESLLDYILKMLKESKEVTLKGKVTMVAHVGEIIDATMNPFPGKAMEVSPTPLVSPVAASPSPTPAGTPSPGDPVPSPSPASSSLPRYSEVFKSDEKGEGAKGSKWLQPHEIKKECYLVEIRSGEFNDIVAIDTQTLWFAYAKRTKGDQLIFEAVISDIKSNTGPKMEL